MCWGWKGVEYMIRNGKQVPFKFYFGAPSCVPATPFETAGAEITAADIEELFQNGECSYLAEMMNWPGVLHHDPVVMEKIALAKRYSKPVDGHAPGLRGEQARQYAAAGITTDHECFTAEEALDKLALRHEHPYPGRQRGQKLRGADPASCPSTTRTSCSAPTTSTPITWWKGISTCW